MQIAPRKLRILLLTYPDHVPPELIGKTDLQKVDWKLEWDVVQALKNLGQDVLVQGIGSDLEPIQRSIESFRPHIVFNLLDEFDGNTLFDQNVVSYLELMGTSYTGCNPRGLMLARDKALAKKIFSFHQIPAPDFVCIPKQRKARRPEGLKFPLFVKSLVEDASLGIAKASIVRDEEKLRERIDFIHESVGTDALVESYIEGREFYVGVWGNLRPQTLPVWELLFKNAPEDLPRIATRRVKWNPAYQERYGITSGPAEGLTQDQKDRIQRVCLDAYRALGITGYARIDLRMNSQGEIFVLEANPNPHIGRDEDFADSAEFAGFSYEKMVWRILHLGLNHSQSSS